LAYHQIVPVLFGKTIEPPHSAKKSPTPVLRHSSSLSTCDSYTGFALVLPVASGPHGKIRLGLSVTAIGARFG
jgi:hypothetical protein